MNVNRITLAGHVTRDPQVKFLPSQVAICEFGIAVNEKYKTKDGEERDSVVFVDCTAFGKTGEAIGKHFKKGKPIWFEGRVKFDQWDDKNGGGKRTKLSAIVEQFQFVGPPDNDGGARQSSAPVSRPANQSRPPAPRENPISEEQQFKEDDIPF